MNVEILAFDGVEELDVCGPLSALAHGGFEVALVAEGGPRQVRTAHGIRLTAPEPGAAPGMLLVPGGGWISRSERGAWAEAGRGALPALIAERFAAGSVIAAVCTGSMLLAAAGLLDGRPAITHHGAIDELAAAGARVIGDARVVDDRNDAATFCQELACKPLDPALLSCVIEQAGKLAPIADLGCGRGHVAAWLASCGRSTCGSASTCPRA